MPRPCYLILLLLVLNINGVLRGADIIPPRPDHYFNDYAHLVSSVIADRLNAELEQFERDTSNQIVVAIYPAMQSDSSIEEYTVRVAQAWHVGQKGRDNGAVLFVFSNDHKVYIQVGYGLEGAIPDITAKRIISDEITPAFHAGNFDAGLTAGVAALMAAAKGEYKGTGATVHDAAQAHGIIYFMISHPTLVLILIFVAFLILSSFFRRGTVYQSSGRSSSMGWQIGGTLLNIALNAALSSGSSRSSGGGGGGGGGGGFSSGGGNFGGGGAGGSW